MALGVGGTGTNIVDIGADPNSSTSTSFSGKLTVNMGGGENTVDIGQNESVKFSSAATFTGNGSAINQDSVNSSNTSGAIPNLVNF
jgi:hypothetical protein